MVQSLVNCTRYNKIFAFQPYAFRSIFICLYSDEKKTNGNPPNSNVKSNSFTIPEPPTTCCMSGCANCVWIEYAQKLTQIFHDGGEKAKQHILESVTDENMRAFLMMELRNMKQNT